MAINIPNKAFLSFGLNQCLNTLYRAAKQIDESWSKEQSRLKALGYLKGNIETLIEHERPNIMKLGQELINIFPSTPEQMQIFLMKLEREKNIDLKDSDFLVSTEDDLSKESYETHEVHLICDNLRSSFNVGSLFRTAEALGIKKIHLCGYTPTPENSKTAKSALGTDKWISWNYWESTLDCLDSLKEDGVTLYAFETEKSALSLSKIKPTKKPAAIILGNERFGLSQTVLKRADELVSIPLSGRKNSLNVASCAALAMYHFCQN